MRNSNITKNRIRVALLLVLAASIIGLAPAFSASARAGSFSINDVSGNYVELANGWAFGNGVVNFKPTSQVALVTFTPPTGTFHEEMILRVAGDNIYNILNGKSTAIARIKQISCRGGGACPDLVEWVSRKLLRCAYGDIRLYRGGVPGLFE